MKQTQSRRYRQQGITLIELMVGVGIMAAIMAIGIPAYNSYISDSREAAMRDVISGVRILQEDRRVQNGEYVEGTWDPDNANTSLQTNLGWSSRTSSDAFTVVVECVTDGTAPECSRTSAYEITVTDKASDQSVCVVLPGNGAC